MRCHVEQDRLVVDTNVLVSAVLSEGGAARAVLRLCLLGEAVPLIGQALFMEYEDVFARTAPFARSPLPREVARTAPFARSPLPREEHDALLDAFLAVCRWTRVSFLWRPNLPDEGDNHLVELAVAGGASAIVTGNERDLTRGELRLGPPVLSPAAYLAVHRSQQS